MHHVLEMDNLIASEWTDLDCSGADLIDFSVSSEAYFAFGRGPADEVRSMWGNVISSTRVNHSVRLSSSVNRNREIIIIIYLLYSSGIDVRVY